MKRCGSYARVSTNDQAEVRDGSLDTQEDQLQRWVQLKSDTTGEDWRIVARYREEGRSGKDTNRPAFQRMLRDVREGKIDVVVCTRFDRVSRSVRDFLDFQETMRQSGVAFVSVGEQWDTTTPMGEFALLLFLGVAQLERRQISERTREKAAWRAEKGLKNGGQILGYDLDPDHPGIPTVNAQERQLVLLAYETFLKEKSYGRTAKILNRRGYRTKSYVSRRGKPHGGTLFSTMAIKRLLTNPFYIGKITHIGDVLEGRHQPLVPMEMWERVQGIVAGNKGSSQRAETLHVYELKGLVRCGECEAAMTPYYGTGKLGRTYFYYICSNRNRHGPDACSMANVPAEALEKVIADRLVQLGKQDRTIDRLVKEAMADMSELLGNLSARREDRSVQRRRVQDQIDALVEGLAGRRTGMKSVGKKLVELEEQAEQLDDEILALDLEIEAANEKAVSAQSMTESLTTFEDLYREATPEERRELVRLRVNRVVWTSGKIRLALLDGPPGGAVTGVQPGVTVGSPSVGLIEHWGRLGQVSCFSRT